jgi:3-methyladenine DNA glycosylase AlkC
MTSSDIQPRGWFFMPEPLKDSLYTQAAIEQLATAFHTVYADFDEVAFLARVFDAQWGGLELKERMRQVTVALHDSLPEDYRTALGIIQQAVPVLNMRSFLTISFCDFVELYGLDDWEVSVPALAQFTEYGSAEFAVRPFILHDPERMLATMLEWSQHENPAVRRLASEGCRPRLPWGIALPNLKADPSPILPILEQLKADESEFVRRSVANNLNDISKDNPTVVVALLRRWWEHHTPEMRWIINHALRTLIKAGHPGALELLGYGTPEVAVANLVLEPNPVKLGDKLTLAFSIEAQGAEAQELMIDYVVHLLRANGKHNAKVFKLARRTLAPGETIDITRKHSFAPVTTRKYYPGEHALEIQINGQRFAHQTFDLIE